MNAISLPGQNSPNRLVIVTPCLNAAPTIDQTIQSVISQAGDFFIRYHVQDGGSTDGTVERLRHWEKELSSENPYVKCRGVRFTWSSETDQGMYDAIIKGFDAMEMAPSDFMAWINGDDIFLPNALATITRISEDHPEIEWIGSPTYIIDRNGKKVGSRPNLTPTAVIREGLCDGDDFHWRHLQQEGMFFKKALWLKAKHALEGYKLAGDWALWREFARPAEYYQFEKPLGAFRRRDGQLSITRRDEYNAEVEAALPVKKRDEAFQRLYDQRDKLPANVIRAAGPGGKMIVEKQVVAERFLNSETAKPVSASLPKAIPTRPKSADDGQSISQLRSILAYDAEWHPAITEKHAFSQAAKLLPEVPGVMYFGFPWATLIKRLNSNKPAAGDLMTALDSARLRFKGEKFVITVCQHTDMLKYQKLFAETGITHVFWAHTARGQDRFPEYKDIKIFPFPLFPARTEGCAPSDDAGKKYLYSFVEAGPDEKYKTQSRKMIVDNLTGDKRGLIASGDHSASLDFRRILEESIFSLCPSGRGPNSVRLWESIGCGAIPVLLADTYLPPGNEALWEEATVSCPERLEDIRALPDRLEALARDEALLERKRHAVRQLRLLYGPACFVYDIQKLFLSLSAEIDSTAAVSQPASSYSTLLGMAAEINRTGGAERPVLDIFILGCGSRVLTDPSGFLTHYKKHKELRMAYRLAISSCSGKYSESLLKALKHNRLVLEPVS